MRTVELFRTSALWCFTIEVLCSAGRAPASRLHGRTHQGFRGFGALLENSQTMKEKPHFKCYCQQLMKETAATNFQLHPANQASAAPQLKGSCTCTHYNGKRNVNRGEPRKGEEKRTAVPKNGQTCTLRCNCQLSTWVSTSLNNSSYWILVWAS